MIQKAMYRLGIDDPKAVVVIGDTPADLAAGRHAGCRYSCGVTNGTHSAAQLARYPQDGLFSNLAEFQAKLAHWLEQEGGAESHG
jgi:phosphoglycolate phosphatase-like HAD superfamily hydrolase